LLILSQLLWLAFLLELLEFEKLLGPVKVPTTEIEKESTVQRVDADFTNFITSCFPDEGEEVKRFLPKYTLSLAISLTIIHSPHRHHHQ